MLATSFFPLAFLIMAVLGAILFGWASPTEAAAIGAFGGLVLAAAYRTLSFEMLKQSVYLTVRTSSMVCWLFVGSWTFSSVFSYLGGHTIIKEFVLSMDLSPVTFLILAQIIIFLLGWPLEWSEIIIIFVPIFLPLLDTFGIDPLFFGNALEAGLDQLLAGDLAGANRHRRRAGAQVHRLHLTPCRRPEPSHCRYLTL